MVPCLHMPWWPRYPAPWGGSVRKQGRGLGPGGEDQEGHPQGRGAGRVCLWAEGQRSSVLGEKVRKDQSLGKGSFLGERVSPWQHHVDTSKPRVQKATLTFIPSVPHGLPSSTCHAGGRHSPLTTLLPPRTPCHGPPAP